MFGSFQPHELQHARLSRPSLPPGYCSNSCPLSRWCHPTISSSVAPFSSCPQCFPASENEKVKVKVTQLCLILCDPMDYTVCEVGSHSLLKGIFPTQGSKPGLLHCRRILYQLSHKGNPKVLVSVAYPFSSRSSWPRNWIRVSCFAAGFVINWAIRAAPASESFLMSWLFASEGQNIRASASTSALPMNIQGWFHFGLTDLISLQSKGFSRVFYSTTVQKHTHCSITKIHHYSIILCNY